MSKDTAPNIHIALAAIAQAIVAIPKDKNNEGQHFKFRGIDDCYNSLHGIFAKHGVVCIPSVESLISSDYINTKGNKVFRSVVTVNYSFVAADGSIVTSKTVGEAFDFGDKATNKAMSAAHKYLLLQTFLIPTRDIADADAENYSFDADAAARRSPGDEYNGKSLEQLEALRNGIMNSGDVPPKELLGKIAELRAEKDDLDMTPSPKPDALPPEPTKPAKEKKATPPKAEAAPKQEPAPEAKAEAAPEAAKPDVFSHVLATVMHSAYKGKKIGDLLPEQLLAIKKGWIDPNAGKFEEGTPKAADRDAILEAIRLTTPPAK